MRLAFLFFFGLVLLSVWSSCSDSTPVGTGLLENQDLQVVFEDDFSIVAKTVITEPTITFRSSNNDIETSLVGQLRDPVFGFTDASFYLQFRYFNSAFPDYTDATPDSAVLMMEIDTTLFYGSPASELNFEVFRLRDNIVDLDTINSDAVFAVDAEPIGVLNGYRPSERRDFVFYSPIRRDTLVVSNVVRIPIDLSFAQEIIDAPINDVTATDDLISQFNGFFVRATTEESVIMGFNLSSLSTNSVFSLYYSPADTTSTAFNYQIGFDRPVSYNHDYSGTAIADIINTPATEDDLLYLQGMNGVDIELDLSDIQKINDNILLNHAELELTVVTEALGDTSFYPPSPDLGLYKRDENGILIAVDDLEISDRTGGREILFDGGLEAGVQLTYSLNFSAHVKDILKGKEDNIVYLSVLNKGDDPSRTIVYGPEHESFPLTLKLTYTKL